MSVIVLQALFTYAPFMETFFATRPLSVSQVLLVAAIGVAVFVVLELEKRVQLWLRRRRQPDRRGAAPDDAAGR